MKHYNYDTLYGNLLARIFGGSETDFEYDNYNLLKKINWPGTGSVNTQFVSDSAGNRLSMTTSQSVGYNFMYDVTVGIPAVLMEQQGTETPKIYVRTPDGRLIARINATVTNPSLDFYYHFDQLGSTLALTNPSGTATDTFKYDAWGNVTRLTGTTVQPYLFVGQLGYYTHYQDQKLDPESQDANKYVMLQLGVRYYAPEIGRFTQHGSPYTITTNPLSEQEMSLLASGKAKKRDPKNDEPPGKPKCQKGTTPVWVTCYEANGKCAYTGKPPKAPSKDKPGTCATFCPKYGDPTFPKGAVIEVPGYGKCVIEDCGSYKNDNGYRNWPWIDVWKESCKGFATGWLCVKG